MSIVHYPFHQEPCASEYQILFYTIHCVYTAPIYLAVRQQATAVLEHHFSIHA